VDGTLVPTRDRSVAASNKNYRHSTNHPVVINADTRLVDLVGRPLPGNRNDCMAWEESGAKAADGNTRVIADGGYVGTCLITPDRREMGQSELPAWKMEPHPNSRSAITSQGRKDNGFSVHPLKPTLAPATRQAHELRALVPDDAFERRSCADGAKGPREYDWAAVQLASPFFGAGTSPADPPLDRARAAAHRHHRGRPCVAVLQPAQRARGAQ
jgi:hypothetical protein